MTARDRRELAWLPHLTLEGLREATRDRSEVVAREARRLLARRNRRNPSSPWA